MGRLRAVAVALFVLFAAAPATQAQTAGDLAIIGWNDSTNEYTIVALADIPSGVAFYFTDNGWTGSAFRGVSSFDNAGSEGVSRLVTNAIIPKGTIIRNTSTGASFTWTISGSISGGGSYTALDLANGDQLYIFRNSVTSDPVFSTAGMTDIFLLDDTGVFENATSSSTGNVTPDLSSGSTALTFDKNGSGENFMKFNPPSCLTANGGTKAQWLVAIALSSNWTFASTGTQPSASDTLNVVATTPTEVCDGADNNCNGTIDEGFPLSITCPPGFSIQCLPAPTANFAGGTTTGCPAPTVTASDGSLVGGACGGTITRTWTATNTGGSVSCTQIITVNDTTNPTFTLCPADLGLECGPGNVAAIAAWLATAAATDTCGSATVTNNYTGLSDLCGNTGAATVTFTATDECGRTATCTGTITVVDTTNPTFTLCPADLGLECGPGNVAAIAAWLATAAATDSCGSATVTNNYTGLSDLCGNTGAALVTFTATDDCGRTATCTGTITVVDTTNPTFTLCPADLGLECGPGNVAAIAAWLATAAATDTCGSATVTNNYTGLSDLCGNTGAALVTFTATDDCGRTATCTGTITVVDTTDPTFTLCPADLGLECGPGNVAAIAAWLATAAATDTCGSATVTNNYTGLSDLCGNTGAATVTFTATDECGRTATCTGTITVVDTTDPTFTLCPADLGLECGAGNVAAIAAWLATAAATDSCGSATVTNNYTGLSDLCGNTGAATVTFTATDECGRTATCTGTITVVDTTNPTFTLCPADLGLECGPGNVAAIAAWLATAAATDTCGSATVTNNYTGLSDLCGNTGAATVTFTATDECGRTATCTGTITVVDTTNPTFTLCPADLGLECGPGNVAAIAAWLATAAATDSCGSATVTNNYTGLSDLCGNTGAATVTFTATDDCGRTATCTGTITVVDTTNPTFTLCPADLGLECGPGNVAAIAAWLATAAATDTCGSATVTNNYTGLSDLCGNTGAATVTFTATDDCGRTATCTGTITVVDTTDPTFTLCPADLGLECGPGNVAAIAAWLATAAATDTCGSATVTNNYTGLSDLCGNTGAATVTFTATDDCGRTATCTGTITVVDTTDPTFTLCPADLGLECGPGNVAAIAAWLATAAATDTCGSATVTNNYTGLSDLCGNTGAATVTFTATDDCGRTATCTGTITVVDTTNPTFTLCPADLGLECGPGNVAAIAAWLATAAATDTCGSATVTNNYTGLSDLCGNTGAALVTFTATDECGRTATCTGTITVVDTTNPTFTLCPADLGLECGPGNVAAIAAWLATAAATDSCGSATVTNNYTGLSDLCGNTGAATVTFTATDECGRTATCTGTITVVDTTDPTFTLCPADLGLECGPGNVAAIAAWLATAAATDTCGSATVTNNYTGLSDLCGNTGAATVTFTATDDCGRTATCTGTITVVDTTNPTFTLCPADLGLECGPGNVAAIAAWLATAAATDTCGSATVTNNYTGLSDLCGNTGAALVTFTATDECGRTATCTGTITVVDTTNPTFTLCPADLGLECGPGNVAAIAAWLATAAATDSCGSATVTNNYTGLSDLCGNTGAATVTFTATDECGRTATCTGTITVVDTTNPTFTLCPADLGLECGPGNVAAIAAWLATAAATDTCGSATVTNNYTGLSDLCGNTGAATVTFTATDDCGRTATCTGTITVVDTTNPTFTLCPADLGLECGAGNVAAIAAWLATAAATDTCGSATVTNNYTGLSDLCGNTGAALVTFTATDDCGRTATCTGTITVVDTTNPTFTLCPAELGLECGPGNVAAIAAWLATAAATDSCGSATVTNNYTGLSDLCGNTGAATVTFTATDECGRTATCTGTITVVDTTNPTFTLCPADLGLECGPGNVAAIAAWLATAAATDTCGSATVTNNYTGLSDLCGNTGAATVTFTATDDCGRTATCTGTITVVDTTNPTFTLCPADLGLECGAGNVAAIAAWLATAAATDTCGSATVTNNYTGLSDLCGNTGAALVTFTATDDCGRTATCTGTITVVDTTNPTFTLCPADLGLECGPGNVAAIAAWLATAAATDSCGSATVTNNYTGLSDLCGNTGAALVTFTATDDCGRTATCTGTITVVDTTNPTFTLCPADLGLECGPGNVAAIAAWLATAAATDTCGSATVTNNYTGLSDLCGNTGAALVTFTATDDCGRTATCTGTITVVDTTDPTFTLCPADLGLECGPGNLAAIAAWLATAAATDSCGSATVTNNYTGLSDLCGNTGAATVTFTATDECGRTATCTGTITVVDTTDPTFTLCPADLGLECGPGNVAAIAAWLATAAATDTCGSATVTNNYTGLSDLCGNTGAALVTFTATDDCGRTATCTGTITVVDTTNPTFTLCPADLGLECGPGNVAAIAAWLATAAATDSCGSATVTNNYTGLSDLCGNTGAATVTFTATDECGRTATCSGTITVVDTTNPTFTLCPADLGLECGPGNVAAIAAWLATAAATDTCGSATVTNNYTGLSDLCGNTGAALVTFTATDDCGRTATCTGTITVVDTTDPTFTLCPADLGLECGPGNLAAIAAWLATAAATDSCGSATVTNNYTGLSDLCGNTGAATVTFTATDECGRTATCTGTITVVDTTDPTFTLCPADLGLECGPGNVAAIAAWLATAAATDTCGSATVTNNYTGLSDLCGNTGAALVTFTATDDCGRTATCTGTITVVDTTDPTFTLCPADLGLECGPGNVAAIAAWLATAAATGTCGSATVTNNYTGLSDLCGNTGAALVTFTATDDCGRTATCTGTITVVDTTDPTFTLCPADLGLECGPGNVAAIAAWLATAAATDTCGSATVTNNYTDLSDLCGNTGAALVTFTATDDCGRTATCTGTITVVDTTDPTFTLCPADLGLECGPGNVAAIAAWIATAAATDSCGSATVTNNYTGLSDLCGDTGAATVTFTATDECGRTATCTGTITVVDTTDPRISCPADFTVPCGSSTSPSTTGTATAADSCDPAPVVSFSDAQTGNCPGPASITRTWTAQDACGNSSTCQQIITLTQGPGQGCVPASVTDLGGECGAIMPFITTSPPVIGEWLQVLLTDGPANSPIVLAAQGQPFPSPISLGSGCVLWVDPAISLIFDTFVTDGNGEFSTQVLVAADPGLINAQLVLQGAVLAPGGPLGVAQLANALRLKFGSCPPFCTASRESYAGNGYAGQVFDFNYTGVFPTGMEIGVFDLASGNLAPNGLRWDATPAGQAALKAFLADAAAASSPLAADASNPITALGAGSLALQTAALQINVAFNDAGILGSPLPGYSSQVYHNHPGIPDSLNGFNVTQILGVANQALAGFGLPPGYSFDLLAALIENLNLAYNGCHESLWGSRFLLAPVN